MCPEECGRLPCDRATYQLLVRLQLCFYLGRERIEPEAVGFFLLFSEDGRRMGVLPIPCGVEPRCRIPSLWLRSQGIIMYFICSFENPMFIAVQSSHIIVSN